MNRLLAAGLGALVMVASCSPRATSGLEAIPGPATSTGERVVRAPAGGAEAPEAPTPGTPACRTLERSVEPVLPGVTLIYGSSFGCVTGTDAGRYQVPVTIANSASSAGTVTIRGVALSHTSPRPRGLAPEATATTTGLPVTLAPGEEASLQASGRYTLAATDEGLKANLHLRAYGTGDPGGPFRLGVNVHLVAAPATP